MDGIDLKFSKNIHLIAIGGAIMHNLALALHNMGHTVTGSDDAIHEPSRSRLDKYGLLPEIGWDAEKINEELDLIILGMHARSDNPELKKALKMGIPVYSFPEFIGQISSNKKRISVAGSHGKTTTTSMIMHILKKAGVAHDYLVGAQLQGYETMVSISDAPLIILESDEYLSSCLDARPKMMHYDPDIVIITGVEWDHMNVFPTKNDYLDAFTTFIQSLSFTSPIFYDKRDKVLENLIEDRSSKNSFGYVPFAAVYGSSGTEIKYDDRTYPVQIFGKHNFANLRAATLVTEKLGIPVDQALEFMKDFEGAQKRMNILYEDPEKVVIRDFAHAPSKVRSTVEAVKERYPGHRLYAALELHTFSSLNPEFLPEYRGSLNNADQCGILYLPESSDHKKLERLSEKDIWQGFERDDLFITNTVEDLLANIRTTKGRKVILLMSSGYWGGNDIDKMVSQIVSD